MNKSTEAYIKLVNKKLNEIYSKNDDKLSKAMLYSISNGGKRVRPILMLEFCKLCGGKPQDALLSACALESIHTFSLIHDDLPCMDNDDMRRGNPSCHKKYGEDIALLAGDALALDAFGLIAKSEIPSERALRVVSEISHSSGAEGMCKGQLFDLENEMQKPDASRLDVTHRLKTGALISTACKCGAIIGGGSEKKIELAEEYGYVLGLAFQIIDDILDVEGDESLLGKPVGSDQVQDKTTYVTLYGLKKSKEMALELTNKALEILEKFDDNEYLSDLTKELLNRRK